jgi:tRNA pseudouridine38-40 synthase
MPRYRLTIEYDGTAFAGWQRQANGFSVQEALETALHAFTGETVTVKGAGRTDSGVHARGQVAHIDLVATWRTDIVRDATNAHLRPHAVAVLSVEEVSAAFDARFSAIRRAYEYRIADRRPPLALDAHRAWHVTRALDAAAMHDAAQGLLGRHDFTTFRAAECQADSPMRTLDRLDVHRLGDGIVVETEARSFLHRQVRSMVGSLKLVGEGRWSAGDLRAALDAADRAACGPVAPAHGLYLMRVDYPAMPK